ncbi:hypothetical protein FBY40_0711 [Microbacterium sp. SLBN-154]|uniref:hypothetical protein n=1 Tax=unclassified Microbacterium TaxID=2609290 RepID=UPI001151B68D|nr:hypothetical protein [Microbacterium sp. SLBN-154]TQK18224.1 hypothetical protein FBY40_0711 [Microbacterium sp. SLBN-154]
MDAATQSLIAGYRSYAGAADLVEMTEAAPAATPGILSFIAASSAACGTATSIVSVGGTSFTVTYGC